MNYYNEIKESLINNEIVKRVKDYSKNKSDLETYYKVGKLLSEAGKHYGEGIIEKGATMSHQLSFSHYVELLPQDDLNKVNYYINEVKTDNLTVTELRKEHIGQIQTYMNYIDKNLKTIY